MNLLSPTSLIYRLAPKRDEYDFKIYLSLCIFRTIQTPVIDAMIKLGMCQKPKVTVSNHMGDALLGRARSREASEFLRTDCDVFLAVDDDIQFAPEDAVRLCKEAYERKAIVAATCVIKRENQPWIASKPLENGPPIVFEEGTEPVEIKWAGAGMVAVHRNVFQAMIEHFKMPLLHPTDLKFWYFFDTMIWQHPNGDHLLLSEDWAFCERAKECGYKTYLHPGIRTVHFGHYGYSLDDLLRPERKHHPKITYEDKGDHVIIPREEGTRITPVLK